MSTITVDDQTKTALEANAKGRGLPLAEYLRIVARADALPVDTNDEARQIELRRRMMRCIDEARGQTPQPNRPLGQSGEFADAMFAKYRS
jgi:antitoxin component of RelBE/YafQ-DinJ toxin-antitoxin module